MTQEILHSYQINNCPLAPNYPLTIRFDGVYIQSIESFIVSLRIRNKLLQSDVCAKSARYTYELLESQHHDVSHKYKNSDLFWQAKPLPRNSGVLQSLLERFFENLCNEPIIAKFVSSVDITKIQVSDNDIKLCKNVLSSTEYKSLLLRINKRILSSAETNK